MPVTTIRVSDELNRQIEAALDYNDTKSDWFRTAAEEKLERDQQADEEATTPK
jgi:predicted transcriptional regulator